MGMQLTCFLSIDCPRFFYEGAHTEKLTAPYIILRKSWYGIALQNSENSRTDIDYVHEIPHLLSRRQLNTLCLASELSE